eukprot:TRINITY_DN22720_c0_g1_i1.p1 TRINITY_DN22720_c0_g1~~TRINITY_DN22720_c0_g1_i1.p1  ORF type:complete len:879 (-),score=200.01 TRINITY_DN22720_c0_g1_i1:147-2783(-)
MPWKSGDRVQALSDGRWYAGSVESLPDEDVLGRWGVRLDVDVQVGKRQCRLCQAVKALEDDGSELKPAAASDPSDQTFLLKGKRYDSEKAFLKAVEESRCLESAGKSSSDYLNDPKAMEEMSSRLFREYIEGEDDPRVTPARAHAMMFSMAVEIGVHPKKIPKPEAVFYRYDFSGDGALDEEETTQLLLGLLWAYRDTQAGAAAGGATQLHLPSRRLQSHFAMKRKLGQGGQGAVYLATEVSSGKERVVKFFNKSNLNAPINSVKAEFSLLRSLDHPQIQRLYDIFEDRHFVYMVSEPYYGGDLQDLVPRASKAGVATTVHWLGGVVRQVVEAVIYLHGRHVMHCDLKEGNAVIVGENLQQPSVVVIDFGLAHLLAGPGLATCGTPGYMPPEVWTLGLWTPKGDVHALGVMLYQMFSGHNCFSGITLDRLKSLTVGEMPPMHVLDGYQYLGPLVLSMLDKNFRNRPTAQQVVDSKFFLELANNDTSLSSNVLEALAQMQKMTQVQGAILADIAATENLSRFSQLNQAFLSLDKNKDGVVTEAEARESLKDALPAELVDTLVMSLIGKDGKVEYTRFMGQVLFCLDADLDNRLWREFDLLDTDGSGHLDASEVAALMKRPALAGVLKTRGESEKDLMTVMDRDQDGKITFEEFAHALLGDRRKDSDTMAAATGSNSLRLTAEASDDKAGATLTQEQSKMVAWSGAKMQLHSFAQVEQGEAIQGQLCKLGLNYCVCSVLLCWWVPILFVPAAASIEDDDCQALSAWLWMVVVSFLALPVVLACCAAVVIAATGSCIAQMGRFGLSAGPLINLCVGVVGFFMYASHKDENCQSDDAGVDAHTLAIVWPFVMIPILVGLYFCVFMGMSESGRARTVASTDSY